MPLAGLLILLTLWYAQNPALESTSNFENLTFSERILEGLHSLAKSFDFSSGLDVLFTIVLLVTVWTGYKYWLLRMRTIQRNEVLLEKLVIVAMSLLFIDRHLILKGNSVSSIVRVVDFGIFFASLYLVMAGSWFLAKTVDRIDLRSDLYCWGLRILGAGVAFIGYALFISSSLVLALSNSSLWFNNIYWIASVCLMLLGAFMIYRSVRRHPAIHIW